MPHPAATFSNSQARKIAYSAGQPATGADYPLNTTNAFISFALPMSIQPKTKGLSHVALRTTDFARTKAFYNGLLGFPVAVDTAEVLGFMVGSVFIGFKQAAPTYPGGNVFTPFNVGLDHIAIACDTEAELHRVAEALQAAGVENTGIKTDTVMPKQYVAFKDPDRIQWEFYMV
jgi:glyoxylase I family protein